MVDNNLEALIRLAESGDRSAANALLRQFGSGDCSQAVVAYLQRCCARIARGESPLQALRLKGSGGRKEVIRREELDRRFEICKAVLLEMRADSGRGKLGRAQVRAQERLRQSPRAVRSAWQDRSARRAAKLSIEFDEEGFDLTNGDCKTLGIPAPRKRPKQ